VTAVPYDFGEARTKVAEASDAMKAAEQFRRDASEALAEAERTYRVALAKRIVAVHGEGAAWTVAQDLARGDKQVADLRYDRDVAKGVLDAAETVAWRHTADRRDLSKLIDWSMRVAPDGQYEQDERAPRGIRGIA
jgi:thymidylate synthase ThyX